MICVFVLLVLLLYKARESWPVTTLINANLSRYTRYETLMARRAGRESREGESISFQASKHLGSHHAAYNIPRVAATPDRMFQEHKKRHCVSTTVDFLAYCNRRLGNIRDFLGVLGGLV